MYWELQQVGWFVEMLQIQAQAMTKGLGLGASPSIAFQKSLQDDDDHDDDDNDDDSDDDDDDDDDTTHPKFAKSFLCSWHDLVVLLVPQRKNNEKTFSVIDLHFLIAF